MLCLQIVLTQSAQPFLNDGCFASLFKKYRFSTNTHIFSNATHVPQLSQQLRTTTGNA
jgi:hypothetical protein